MYPLLRLAFSGTFLGLCFAAVGHAGQPAVGSPPDRDPAPGSDAPRLIPATGRPIELEVNKGTLVRLARPANTVFVADPDIADVQVKSPELVYIVAKSPGATVIYAVDANDEVLLNAPVRVAFDLAELRRSLQQLVPDGLISADSAGSNLVLSGKVGDAGQAEKVQALAAALVGGIKGSKVINRMSVVTPNQVNLQVRIAEVDRNILKQIGVDWTKFGSNGNYKFQTLNNQSPRNITSVSPGSTTVSNGVVTITPPSITSAIPTASFLTIGMFPFSTSATIEAMATEGFVTILAEPNLTAVSGQTADFLAGGSFPVPVIQSVSTGAPTVTVQYKQYGVQLAFTPTIIDSRHLSLKVAPQVSQLDYSNAVTENGVYYSCPDDPQRTNHRRPCQRPELRVGRTVDAQHFAETSIKFLGSAIFRSSARCFARSSFRTTRPSWSSSSPHTWCSRRRPWPPRRPMASRRRTTLSRCCLATRGGAACRRRRAVRSTPAAAV